MLTLMAFHVAVKPTVFTSTEGTKDIDDDV
jgi:hypothetical protein